MIDSNNHKNKEMDFFDFFSIIFKYKLTLILPFIVSVVLCFIIYFSLSPTNIYKVSIQPGNEFEYRSPKDVLLRLIDKKLTKLNNIFKEVGSTQAIDLGISPSSLGSDFFLNEMFSYTNFISMYHKNLSNLDSELFKKSSSYKIFSKYESNEKNTTNFSNVINNLSIEDNQVFYEVQFQDPLINNLLFEAIHEYIYIQSLVELNLVFKYYLEGLQDQIDQIKYYITTYSIKFAPVTKLERYKLLLYFFRYRSNYIFSSRICL